MKEFQAYRAPVNKMGFVPPECMIDQRELRRFYANVIKIAPLRYFNCNKEGHINPNCPVLRGNLNVQRPMPMGHQPVAQEPIMHNPVMQQPLIQKLVIQHPVCISSQIEVQVSKQVDGLRADLQNSWKGQMDALGTQLIAKAHRTVHNKLTEQKFKGSENQ